jgi:hypothetical protein
MISGIKISKELTRDYWFHGIQIQVSASKP